MDDNNNDTIIVSIKDPGTGVDPSLKEKLFEKFVTKSSNGAGLGLYLSKKIVEAHGGKIWIERNTTTIMKMREKPSSHLVSQVKATINRYERTSDR